MVEESVGQVITPNKEPYPISSFLPKDFTPAIILSFARLINFFVFY